jgi:hypothetical protein
MQVGKSPTWICGVIPGRRESGEPGIHNHRPRAMDSGLATFGGAPE